MRATAYRNHDEREECELALWSRSAVMHEHQKKEGASAHGPAIHGLGPAPDATCSSTISRAGRFCVSVFGVHNLSEGNAGAGGSAGQLEAVPLREPLSLGTGTFFCKNKQHIGLSIIGVSGIGAKMEQRPTKPVVPALHASDIDGRSPLG